MDSLQFGNFRLPFTQMPDAAPAIQKPALRLGPQAKNMMQPMIQPYRTGPFSGDTLEIRFPKAELGPQAGKKSR